MQKGIIKEIKEVPRSGKDPFYEVILQDDTKMTTFDPKIKESSAGDQLDFEVIIKGKYNNLKDGWKLTKQASSSSESHSGNGMSKEDWAKKDRLERDSIEAQTAVKAILVLVGTGTIGEELEPVYQKALAWCERAIDRNMAPGFTSPSALTTGAPILDDDLFPEDKKFKNVGEFFKVCLGEGIPRSAVLMHLNCLEANVPKIDTGASWRIIYEEIIKPKKANRA